MIFVTNVVGWLIRAVKGICNTPPQTSKYTKNAGIELYVLYEYLAAMYTSWFALSESSVGQNEKRT